MDDLQSSKYFEIGKIVNTHGVRGCVRVLPMTFDPTRFELLDNVMLSNSEGNISLDIDSVTYHKQFVILKFRNINDMDSAEKLKNRIIRIPEAQALPLGDDEYYIRDLIGLRVITDEGEDLGKLIDVHFTGANDVYAVRASDKSDKPNNKDLLIPAIKECIINVDIKNGVMTVKLLKGLR